MAKLVSYIDGKKQVCPHHSGEYCGNYHPNSHLQQDLHLSPEETKKHHEAWLKKMRFGVPRLCLLGDSVKMEAEGYVGLYLLRTESVLYPGEQEVPTPPELMEPGRESEYNINGHPGLPLQD